MELAALFFSRCVGVSCFFLFFGGGGTFHCFHERRENKIMMTPIFCHESLLSLPPYSKSIRRGKDVPFAPSTAHSFFFIFSSQISEVQEIQRRRKNVVVNDCPSWPCA